MKTYNIVIVDNNFSNLEDTNFDSVKESSKNWAFLSNDIQTDERFLSLKSDWEKDEDNFFNLPYFDALRKTFCQTLK